MIGTAPRGFFKVIRFDRSVRGSEQAIRYAAFRSEDVRGKEPCIFDKRTDSADVRGFVQGLEDPTTRHHTAAKAYHCVFSLPRQDFERAGMTDWRDAVREVMQRYEQETGKKLQWIAMNHDNPKRPHCHVIIKATYEDRTGRTRKLYLNRRELDRIKELTGRALEARGLTLERPAPKRQVQRAEPRGPNMAGSILVWLQQQMKAAQQEHQADQERAEMERRRQTKDGPGSAGR